MGGFEATGRTGSPSRAGSRCCSPRTPPSVPKSSPKDPGCGGFVRGRFAPVADPFSGLAGAVETVFNPDTSLGDKLRVLRLRDTLSRTDTATPFGGADEERRRRICHSGGSPSGFESGSPLRSTGEVTLDRSLSTASSLFEHTSTLLTQGAAALPAGLGAVSEQLASRAAETGVSRRGLHNVVINPECNREWASGHPERDRRAGLEFETVDDAFAAVGDVRRDDAEIRVQPGVGYLRAEQVVDLVDTGSVGHHDLHEHRPLLALDETDTLDRLAGDGVDTTATLLVGDPRAAPLHVEPIGDPDHTGFECQWFLLGLVADDGVQNLAFHPHRLRGAVELREQPVEHCRGQRDRVVGVSLPVDDVTDVVEDGREPDDNWLVGLGETLLACTVELDTASFEEFVETEGAVTDNLYVFWPVVVVLHPVDRVDVLCLEIGGDLFVGVDGRENLVETLVGKGVRLLGVVGSELLAARQLLTLVVGRCHRIVYTRQVEKHRCSPDPVLSTAASSSS